MSSSRFVSHTLIKGFKAKVALAAHRLVIIDATDDSLADYPAAQFAVGIVGITAHAAAIGEPVDVIMGGQALLQVDGNAANIAVGDSIVAHDNTGYGQAAAGGAAISRRCVGTALAASTADGDLIPVSVALHKQYFAS